jgi:hypothetical protein
MVINQEKAKNKFKKNHMSKINNRKKIRKKIKS